MTRKRGAQSMFLILQVVALHVHPPITSIALPTAIVLML